MTHRAWLYWRLLAAKLSLCGVFLAAGCRPTADVTPSHDGAPPQALQAQVRPVARVLVLGDSISEGVGARRPELSYAGLLVQNEDTRYPEETGQDLQHRYGPALRYVNVAHSGDTTRQVIAEQLPRLQAPHDSASLGSFPVRGHTVVFMTVGGNDLRGAMGPRADYEGPALRNAVANLQHILAFFGNTDSFPDGVSLYFASVYDVTDGTDTAHNCLRGMVVPGLARGLLAWNHAYEKLSQEPHGSLHVTYLNGLALYRGHGFHYDDPHNPYFNAHDPSLWLSDRDCIHPNHRGHHELRKAFWQAFLTSPPPPQ